MKVSPIPPTGSAYGRVLVVLACLSSVFLMLAACSATKMTKTDGTVLGIAAPCVGLALPGKASVTVYANRDGHVVGSQRVILTKSPGNPYHLTLPVGTYVMSAPKSGLPKVPVTIRAGKTVTLNFIPSCK